MPAIIRTYGILWLGLWQTDEKTQLASDKAGSMTLKQGLVRLAKTARILQDWSTAHGSSEHYFLEVMSDCKKDAKQAALKIGIDGRWKLPGFGIPLAAEALRNLGFDVCKPDRHVCRAMGAFDLVQFRKWPDRSNTKSPTTDESELLATMTVVEDMANRVGVRPTYLDNALWLICAKMGLHMSNSELADLASEARSGC